MSREIRTGWREAAGETRAPRKRVDTELFHLVAHAGNLPDRELLDERVDLAGVRLLADDYAPAYTLVFEAEAGE